MWSLGVSVGRELPGSFGSLFPGMLSSESLSVVVLVFV